MDKSGLLQQHFGHLVKAALNEEGACVTWADFLVCLETSSSQQRSGGHRAVTAVTMDHHSDHRVATVVRVVMVVTSVCHMVIC
eukprot:1156888-Pelagomonas_calceolata.AAC.6